MIMPTIMPDAQQLLHAQIRQFVYLPVVISETFHDRSTSRMQIWLDYVLPVLGSLLIALKARSNPISLDQDQIITVF